MTNRGFRLRPFFLDGPVGRLFCLATSPRDDDLGIGVLFAPPFAEEMNKSRRQASLQARAFAEAGITTLMVDLFGTGDSEGNFEQASWEVWLNDLAAGADWLQEDGARRLVIWGIRSGSLLALDLLPRLRVPPERIIFWQPVLDGTRFVNQFLRLRSASEMLFGGNGITVQNLRESLAEEGMVEVAGYGLTMELISILDLCTLHRADGGSLPVVNWFEVSPTAGQSLARGSERLINQWKANGVQVEPAVINGEMFWATTETTVVEELLAPTTKAIVS